MSKPDTSIDPRILQSAKNEFLSCGYEKASTNVICKNAGVTSGALYKRYSGKDELFCALVSPVADQFKELLKGVNDDFHNLPDNEKNNAAFAPKSQTNDFVDFIDFVYRNFDVFKLLIESSRGSSYENYLHELVDILVASTMRFIKETNREAIILGKKVTPEIIHILITAHLNGLFEPVIHNMSREDARIYTEQLQYFFNAGWADILH